MAEKLANNRNQVATAPAAGLTVVNQHTWDVEASANNDTVVIGELPAYHRLVPELCSLIFDGDTAAMTVSICVEEDANAIFAGSATLANTFTRAACNTYELCQSLGVSQVNRKIYAKLTTAPATSGGQLIAQIGSAAG